MNLRDGGNFGGKSVLHKHHMTGPDILLTSTPLILLYISFQMSSIVLDSLSEYLSFDGYF